MKKILGISLVALMSVTAANAEIASKAYVNQEDNAVKALVTAEQNRATGVEGALSGLSTTDKTNLVAAINEVDSHADTNANGITSLNTLVGTIPQGATATTIVGYVDEKATAAQNATTYTADGTTVTLNDNQFSATTGAIAENGTGLATTGTIYTAIEAAKTAAAETAQAKVDALASNAVATNASDIDALEGRMDTAEGDIDALEGLVGNTAVSTQISNAIADANLSQYQTTANKVTTINAQSDDTHYPSAAAVYTAVQGANTATTDAIADLDSTGTAEAKKVITGVTMTDGKITSVTSADPLTNANYQLQNTGGEAGKYALTAVYDGNTLTGYAWELIERATTVTPGDGE